MNTKEGAARSGMRTPESESGPATVRICAPARPWPGRATGLLLGLAGVLALAAGCSDDDPPRQAFLGVPGPRGGTEAAPCESGSTQCCIVTLGVHGSVLICYEGTQTCVDGQWGECTDGTVTEVPVSETAWAAGPGTTQPQAYSEPTGCIDNPCDPYCRTYEEAALLPLEADTDPGAALIGWSVGSAADIPSGLYDKGFAEPCTGGWDCQYNSICFAPYNAACAHGVCEVGPALDRGSDAPPVRPPCDQGNHNNGSCVAAICDVDPSCCGAPTLSECADGQLLGPDRASCYSFEVGSFGWEQARQVCRNNGAGWDLVDIQSPEENAFVLGLITQQGWIGANDLLQEGSFRWLEGPALDYANWNSGEPNDLNGEDCAEMRTNGTWNDLPCQHTLPAICKGPRADTVSCAHDPCTRGEPLSAECNSCVAQICAALPSCCDAAGLWEGRCAQGVEDICGQRCQCRPDEQAYGGSCYYYHQTLQKGVFARTACAGRGSGYALVSIDDAGENAYAASYGNVWIGLTDDDTNSSEGNWLWLSGSPPGVWNQTTGGPLYVNWNGGTPGAGDCALLGASGTWTAQNCDDSAATNTALCEGPGGRLVADDATAGPPGTWTQDCVDLVYSVCDAECNPDDSTDSSGDCGPWYAGETDPECAGIDLSADIPCAAAIPVCNHGNTEAPAGIRIIHYPAESQQYPSPNPDQDVPQMAECFTEQAILPGNCIMVDSCADTLGQNREIMVNPPGPDHVPECSSLDNWTLYSHNACVAPECFGGTAGTTPLHEPVDIVFIVDTSLSMPDESRAVQQNLNRFAARLEAAGLDYKVIIFARYGDVDIAVGGSNYPVCIPGPLGADGCADPSNDPLQLNPPHFYHYSVDVCNHTSWCQLLGGYSAPDELPSSRSGWQTLAPQGWGAWLRGDANKVFVIVSDEYVDCNDYGYDFDSKDTAADGTTAAAQFDAALRALAPEQFGGAASRDYVWHSIVGMPANGSPTQPWPPSAPIQTAVCATADGSGSGYQALSILTGGLRFSSCESANYDAFFQAIAEQTIAQAQTPCRWSIDARVPINPSETEVTLVARNEAQVSLVRVRDAAACTDNGWYYDNPLDPNTLALCPGACAAAHDDPGSRLIAEIGCAKVALPTSFYEIYEAACPRTGGPQWSYLAWDTLTPDDGAQVQFQVRTAATEEELAEAQWVEVATVTHQNEVCTLLSCPADVYAALGVPGGHYRLLELEITLLPGLTSVSPIVDSWEITYSCPPDE
jgi:hypothetical protein